MKDGSQDKGQIVFSIGEKKSRLFELATAEEGGYPHFTQVGNQSKATSLKQFYRIKPGGHAVKL